MRKYLFSRPIIKVWSARNVSTSLIPIYVAGFLKRATLKQSITKVETLIPCLGHPIIIP